MKRQKGGQLKARLAFAKVDRARHGLTESPEETKERINKHFPLFRSMAGFYNGFEARDPEGDALLFAFSAPRNALRFGHALAALLNNHEAVMKFYRVALAEGEAEFHPDGNIVSPGCVDLLPDIERSLKPKEYDIARRGLSLGSLIDERIWGCVADHLYAEGMEVGEIAGSGKRTLPKLLCYAASSEPSRNTE